MYPSRKPVKYDRSHWRFSRRDPGQPVCICGKGYGSKFDGLCIFCRGMTGYEAWNPPKVDTRGQSVRSLWWHMNRNARIIRFYTSECGGDIDHFGIGLPTDDMENGWKVCFDKKVVAIVAAKSDVLPVPTARRLSTNSTVLSQTPRFNWTKIWINWTSLKTSAPCLKWSV